MNPSSKIKYFAVILFAFLLASCGASSTTTVEAIDDLSLTSVDIDNIAFDFTPTKTGPYEIEVENNISTISVVATAANNLSTLIYSITNSGGTSAPIDRASGEEFEVQLKEGENILIIQVENEDGSHTSIYQFQIYRQATEASLALYSFFIPVSDGEAALSLTPNFQLGTYFYTAKVSYGTCRYVLQAYAQQKYSTVEVNGTEIEDYELYYQNLDPGENTIHTYVSSSNGARTERYTTNITRTLPSNAELRSNARLSGLSIDGSDLNYICDQSSYSIDINNNAQSINLTATTETDGAKIVVGNVEVESGVSTEIPLEQDANELIIQTLSINGAQTNAYHIYLNRLDVNRVYVGTPEALQLALANANPSDEIRLRPGIYTSTPSFPASGSAQAHFHSNRSGTKFNPIYLIADSSSEETALEGSQGLATIGLVLSGDYWVVSGLDIRNVDTGIKLAGANHTKLLSLEFSSITDSALVTSNGASNTILMGSSLEANTKDSSEPISKLTPMIRFQSDLEPSTNNQILRNSISANLDKPMLVIDDNVDQSVIEGNSFSLNTTNTNSKGSPVISLPGANSLVRFNTFYLQQQHPDFNTISAESNAESQGTIKIYQNRLDTEQQSLSFVHSNSAIDLQVGDNYLASEQLDDTDLLPVSYSGNAVNIVTDLSPRFQIKALGQPDVCVGIVESEDVDDLYWAVTTSCSNRTSTLWQLELAGDHYTYIKNLSIEDGYLMPKIGFSSMCDTPESATSNAYLAEKWSGFVQQWIIYTDDKVQYLINKNNTSYGLTIGGGAYSEGSPLVACPIVGIEEQQFELVEIN